MSMMRRHRALIVMAFVLAACGPSPQQPATQAESVSIADGWVRATPPGAQVAAGYLTLSNGAGTAVRLTGGATAVAAKTEIHTMSMDGGMMRMRPLDSGLEIPAGGAAALAPGDDHLMLMGLKRVLAEGEQVAVELRFADGSTKPVTLPVRAADAASQAHR